MFDIYIPVFNNIFCVEYQLKTLNAFIQEDNFTVIIIDNNIGRHPEASRKTKELCDKYGAIYVVNNDKTSAQIQEAMEKGYANAADQHGYTLSLVYHQIVKARKPKYFGILDQDCFVFKPTDLKPYLDKNGAFGKVVPTHPDEKDHKLESGEYAWNLHVVCNFFKFDFVKDLNLDFQPGKREKLGIALDTGGMNWPVLYKGLNAEDYVIPENHYYYYDDRTLLNKDGTRVTNTHYEIINDNFIHMVHSPGGSASEDYLHPKTSYIKGFLDSCLINYGKEKLGPSNTGFYSMCLAKEPEKFKPKNYPNWKPQYDHDSDEIFQRYVSEKIFVETGTSSGRSVKQALARGAKEVRSVEGSQKDYENNLEKFKEDDRVKLWHGRSEEKLQEMISDINEPAVFWLDAHPTGPDSFGHEEFISGNRRYSQHSTLSIELEVIANHPVKNHVVLIDDQNYKDLNQLREVDLYKKALLKANPYYQFYFYQKPIRFGFSEGAAILVAFVP